MEHLSFHTPLVIFARDPSEVVLISTVAEALAFLFVRAQREDNRHWKAALESCRIAELGRGTTTAARSTFVAAIRQAGMLVDVNLAAI
ncbi:DUF982 domain-containing protein [Mesorhizobium sp. RP14(2022)]|uniref:DUF982 domain-containing protein n=1 Tax=Mesorhizobium liriopis TaxID=2953882 RepID=A0ABT1CCU2_9HYPH|nr:DUF982 domain-containing protein [Mesorhizobium liriopis]MCO6052343.1 DUF982 domain-containing protein [Mesorhizobium liriopis]